MRGLIASDKLKIGYQKKGTAEKILAYVKKKHPHLFIKILPSYQKKKQIISSTLIRHQLQIGDIQSANKLLWLPFHIESNIISGKKKGRKINYPTINIQYPLNTLDIKKGVYVTLCLLKLNKKNILLPAMTFFGCSFANQIPLVESYLFDFSKNIYNQQVVVFFLKYLRDKKDMKDLLELQKQLNVDKNKTAQFLKTQKYQKLFATINSYLESFVLK